MKGCSTVAMAAPGSQSSVPSRMIRCRNVSNRPAKLPPRKHNSSVPWHVEMFGDHRRWGEMRECNNSACLAEEVAAPPR